MKSLAGFVWLCLFTASLGYAQEKIGPWDLTQLKQTPRMHWVSQEGPIHSLLYSNEPYRGQETEVFAFYASPKTLGEAGSDKKFPAVVLIHGGGGTAFAEWAWLWAKRGYAAIAMDLAGCRPIDPKFGPDGTPVRNQSAKPDTRTRLPNGGPDQGHDTKFDTIGGSVEDDWPYHAISAVVRAHSLIRSFPEVDADHTAVSGISWGGYTTCIVASVDDRFKAAVPVYGCGFLFEGESVQKPSIDKLKERREDWTKTYDPSAYLGRCRVPILFVNGTNDVHYPLDSYRKSFDLVSGQKQMRIEVKMPHGHPPGWAPPEIGLFIDTYCRQGTPLPVIEQLAKRSDSVEANVLSAKPLKSAALHYTVESGKRSDRNWQTLPATIEGSRIKAPALPADANTWFITVTDDRNATASSVVQIEKAGSNE